MITGTHSSNAALPQILEILASMSRTTQLEPLIHQIERTARETFHCEGCVVLLLDARQRRFVGGAGGIPCHHGRAGLTTVGAGDLSVMLQLANSLEDIPGPFTLPLTLPDGSLAGLLRLGPSSQSYSGEELMLASALAALASLAVHRQMLLEDAATKETLQQELMAARQVLHELMPSGTKHFHDYEISAWFQPCGWVGGDSFDYQVLSPTRMAFSVFDASGHGLGPTLAAVECRALLRATLAGSDLQHSAVIVNETLDRELSVDRFVTACFGTLEALDGRLEYVSAGQAPLLHYRADTGEFAAYGPSGPPFGAVPEAVFYPVPPVWLRPGDLFVIATDGLLEWRRGEEEYGQQRLMDQLARSSHGPVEEILHQLRLDVGRFAGSAPQSDDVTVLVIKRKSLQEP